MAKRIHNVPPVISRGAIPAVGAPDRWMWERFGCNTLASAPATPDLLPGLVGPGGEEILRINRKVYHGSDLELVMPDGQRIEVWGFEDPDDEINGLQFPSKLMRFREGQIIQSTVETAHGPHSIHHHGIEPETFNDGVGHISFEVEGMYTYQFRAESAGTYLYHCHRNTTLHFEMGMYGPLIIDPAEGPGRLFEGGPAYDHERIWAVDEIDSRWHGLDKDAGIECDFYTDENPRLNEFNPDYFLVSGCSGEAPQMPLDGEANMITDPKVAVECEVGESVLLRVMNAGYANQRFSFPGLDAEIVGVDGRGLGQGDGSGGSSIIPMQQYSRPFDLDSGETFTLSTASRWDVMLRPRRGGTYYGKIEFFDWVSNEKLAETRVQISVSGGVLPITGPYHLLLGS